FSSASERRFVALHTAESGIPQGWRSLSHTCSTKKSSRGCARPAAICDPCKRMRQINLGAQSTAASPGSLLRRPLMKTYRIAAIPGDGIGAEVVSAGIEVLHALAKREGKFQFEIDHFDWGGEYYKKHGRMMPQDGRSLIRSHDAILFGSAGHPEIPD